MPLGNIEIWGANFHLIEPEDVQFTKELSRCKRYKGSQIPLPWFISFFFRQSFFLKGFETDLT